MLILSSSDFDEGRTTLFQNTSARFDGRPEVATLTKIYSGGSHADLSAVEEG
jgi:hypothetical protein